jgi:hypothetical protein
MAKRSGRMNAIFIFPFFKAGRLSATKLKYVLSSKQLECQRQQLVDSRRFYTLPQKTWPFTREIHAQKRDFHACSRSTSQAEGGRFFDRNKFVENEAVLEFRFQSSLP